MTWTLTLICFHTVLQLDDTRHHLTHAEGFTKRFTWKYLYVQFKRRKDKYYTFLHNTRFTHVLHVTVVIDATWSAFYTNIGKFEMLSIYRVIKKKAILLSNNDIFQTMQYI